MARLTIHIQNSTKYHFDQYIILHKITNEILNLYLWATDENYLKVVLELHFLTKTKCWAYFSLICKTNPQCMYKFIVYLR